jgi:hypothetical protein
MQSPPDPTHAHLPEVQVPPKQSGSTGEQAETPPPWAVQPRALDHPPEQQPVP